MDGHGYDEAEYGLGEDQDLVANIVSGLVHIVGLWFFFQCCWARCCKRGSSPGDQQQDLPEVVAEVGQLQEKKRVFTSYLLWLFAGLVGAHHFYLGRVMHGLVSIWSLNFLGLGWLADAVLIPFYVRSFNARCTTVAAPYDHSRRTLLCRLPLTVLALILCLAGVFFFLPSILHALHVVDIDRLAAQTEANPYETLGLSRDATLAEAKTAYRKKSLEWHPDRNLGCGKTCEGKMAEVGKAFEAIKKRRAPPPPDRTWEGVLQDYAGDWLHILEALGKLDEEPEDRGRGRPRDGAGARGGGKAHRASSEL